MILKIIGVYDRGDIQTQRLSLQVIADGNLKNYAIVDNTFTQEGELSNEHRHFYSFPDFQVKKDEFVVLCTKVGTTKPNCKYPDGVYHFFFWNLNVSVWNENDTAYLLQMSDSSKKQFISKK